ncbi:MAG TPA: arginase family protein [Gemmata sp.]|nr:arginase family protein [Gemmata sp.]
MRTTAVVFPFDQFGGAGTGAGAQLLGDTIREILDDAAEEARPCRSHCLLDKVEVRETPFATMEQVREWRTTGRHLATKLLRQGDFVLWLGGNHLSVLPVLEELGSETLVVQFDAHLDVYSFHDTTAELSHGNYLRHFAAQRPRIVNVGHRDQFLVRDEIVETFDRCFSAIEVAANVDRVADELRALAAAAGRVWIDFDADALDPAAMPAVQQPLPFGLTGPIFLKLFEANPRARPARSIACCLGKSLPATNRH